MYFIARFNGSHIIRSCQETQVAILMSGKSQKELLKSIVYISRDNGYNTKKNKAKYLEFLRKLIIYVKT